MDFALPSELEDIRVRTRAFVAEHVLPLEADPKNFDEHENIRLDRLEDHARRTAAAIARERRPGLLADLDNGHYFPAG